MLQEIAIKNFAIIDDLHIRFSDGFTILSGETGAGKSIIINAVNLLLGSRATAGFIRTGAETAELSAAFDLDPDSPAARLLKENDLDPSDGLLVRRIIARNNRHKIYINNTLSTIRLLTAITQNLASISGQHAHQGLLDEDQHLLILDQFGHLMGLREKVRAHYQDLQPLIRKLTRLKALQDRQAEERELLRFQQQEILAAHIETGEDAELERELLLLKNAEVLYQAVFSAVEALYGARNAVFEKLGAVGKDLEKASRIDPELTPRVERLADVTFRVEDIVDGLRSYLDNIRIDPKRLETADDRLNALKKLKRKYGGSIEAVLSRLEAIEKELSAVENISEEIAVAEADIADQREQLIRRAKELSEKRAESAAVFSEKVEKELDGLNMADTRFRIALSPIPVTEAADPFLILEDHLVTDTGLDRAAFMIAPNVGEEMKPLADIASGGELSRVVLALKAILAEIEAVGTVIFDEVDAGIGGGTAEVVGQKLAILARYHQVICITHLAQIAKFGDHHFRIAKEVSEGRTRTVIEPLNSKERVREIARMLGGVKLTQATLDHAMEMVREE